MYRPHGRYRYTGGVVRFALFDFVSGALSPVMS